MTNNARQSQVRKILSEIQVTDLREVVGKIQSVFESEYQKRSNGIWEITEGKPPLLDSCVDALPTGNEVGVSYGLDFGGSAVRVVRVVLENGRIEKMEQSSRSFDGSLGKRLRSPDCPATEIFDVMAMLIKEMLERHEELQSAVPIGFCFSFGIDQKTVSSGIASLMAKGFDTGVNTDCPLIGADVCQLLNDALRRLGLSQTVTALANDTVGTMLAAAQTAAASCRRTVAALIVGSGMNVCYWEEKAKDIGYNGHIINTEIGTCDFGMNEHPIDKLVDKVSPSPNKFNFEKLVGGFAVAETASVLIRMIFEDHADIWDTAPGEGLHVSCEALAQIWGDDSADLEAVDRCLVRARETSASVAMPECELSMETKCLIRDICAVLLTRSARVAAASVLCCLNRIDIGPDEEVVVGVTGSVIEKCPKYQQEFKETLQSLRDFRLAIEAIADGSGLGVAILASTVAGRASAG